MYWKSIEETAPSSFIPIEYTVTGKFIANLNSGAGGPEVYFCYKKENSEDEFFQNELGWQPCHGFCVSF